MKTFLGRMKAKDACPPRKRMPAILWSWLGSLVGIYAIGSCAPLLAGTFSLGGWLPAWFLGAAAVLVYGGPHGGVFAAWQSRCRQPRVRARGLHSVRKHHYAGHYRLCSRACGVIKRAVHALAAVHTPVRFTAASVASASRRESPGEGEEFLTDGIRGLVAEMLSQPDFRSHHDKPQVYVMPQVVDDEPCRRP